MDHADRQQFRAEMDAFRKDFNKDRLEGNLCGCNASTQTDVRRERRNEEFHDKRVEFHREIGDEHLDENRGTGQDYKKGGY